MANTTNDGLRRQELITRNQQEKLLPKVSVLTYRKQDQRPVIVQKERPCFVIKEIQLSGMHAIKFNWLLTVAKDYLHKCVGAKGFGDLISTLNSKLIEKGYVTSKVILNPQNMATGILRLELSVGKVENISKAVVKDGKRQSELYNWGIWQNAVPMSKNDILNIRNLEHGIENMKRLSSQISTTMQIEPGNKPNYSKVYLQQKPISFFNRVNAGISLDNSNRKYLGREQLSSYLGLDNLLGINDTLMVNFNSSLHKPSHNTTSYGYGLSLSIPFNYLMFSYVVSRNYHSRDIGSIGYVSANDSTVLTKGNSTTHIGKLAYLIYRSMSDKLEMFLSINRRKAKNFIEQDMVKTDLSKQSDNTANVNYGMDYSKQLSSTSFSVSLSYQHGVKIFGAKSGKEGEQVIPKLIKYSIGIDKYFMGATWQYISNINGQYTKDKALDISKIEIGGRYTVRGFYTDQTLLGASGQYFRQAIQRNIGIGRLILQPYWAVDFGHVYGYITAGHSTRWLLGSVIGLQANYRKVNISGSIGRSIHRPQEFINSPWVMYISISVRI